MRLKLTSRLYPKNYINDSWLVSSLFLADPYRMKYSIEYSWIITEHIPYKNQPKYTVYYGYNKDNKDFNEWIEIPTFLRRVIENESE